MRPTKEICRLYGGERWCVLTKSIPFRRWIPTNGSLFSTFLMNLLASFSIFTDHFIYFWSHLFLFSTGKEPGAPMRAITGYFDAGNLNTNKKRKYLYCWFSCCFIKILKYTGNLKAPLIYCFETFLVLVISVQPP